MRIIENKAIIPVQGTDKTAILNNLTNQLMILNNHSVEEFEKIINGEKIENEALINELIENKLLLSEVEEFEIKRKLIKKLENQHLKEIKQPKVISLLITYNCNFKCSYCYEKVSDQRVMTKKQIDLIAKEHGENVELVHLFGGEPLLIENIELIRYLMEKFKNCTFATTTNGFYLEEYSELLSQYKFQKIEVSLDGPDYIHDKNRKHNNIEPTCEKIFRGIEKILEYGIKVKLHFNFTTNTYEPITEFVEELSKKYSHYVESSLLTFLVTPILQIDSFKDQLLSDVLLENRITNDLSKESYFPIVNLLTNNQSLRPQYNYCYAQRGTRIYDPRGYIYSCLTSVGIEGENIGKYDDHIVIDENSKYFTRSIAILENCKECNVSTFCGGGCPKGALDNNGDCSQFKYHMDYVLPNLIKNRLIGVEE